jgi:Protein of unknown function (DUF2934)
VKNAKHSVTERQKPEQKNEEIQDLVRQRAYELFEQRSQEHGHDFDDWIAAESEVLKKSTEQAE